MYDDTTGKGLRMSDAVVEVLTHAEAIKQRREIISRVGDIEKFRLRGESFELDADELVLYDELLTLDYLLDE